jgi:hypothetical protein
MAEAREPQLPPNVPPALRAALDAALAWLRELDREAAETESVRRPR